MSKVKILFVCLGNICRSPLAEGIFRQRVIERSLTNSFEIDSCGTAGYHVGELPDRRSVANALANGVSYTHHARQLDVSDFHTFDYIIPMDASNHHNIIQVQPLGGKAEVVKMRDFDPLKSGGDVPDPYYGGEQGFQEVFDILDRSVKALLQHLIQEHNIS